MVYLEASGSSMSHTSTVFDVIGVPCQLLRKDGQWGNNSGIFVQPSEAKHRISGSAQALTCKARLSDDYIITTVDTTQAKVSMYTTLRRPNALLHD